MASITDMKPGDYVKVNGRLEKISSVYGVDHQGHLNKPSEGGFGVRTESGRTVSMWEAEASKKAAEVDGK
jgi:hypothetical protein